MNDEVPHDVGYVLGNGPSRDRNRTRYDGVTYGCNSIHNGGLGFSFVVFMKIPTHWKEQHALPWLKDARNPFASDFQFLLGQGRGPVQPIPIPLCPEDEGRMLFFPSWLTHQVFPFYECEEERITISGNIIPKINANT